MVTAQVLSKEDECDFILKVHCVGGEGDEPIMFGVVGEVPNGRTDDVRHFPAWVLKRNQ